MFFFSEDRLAPVKEKRTKSTVIHRFEAGSDNSCHLMVDFSVLSARAAAGEAAASTGESTGRAAATTVSASTASAAKQEQVHQQSGMADK